MATPRKKAVKADAATTVQINQKTLPVKPGQVDAAKVAQVAADMATKHGWCDEVTKALQDMGVVDKPEMKEAIVTISFKVTDVEVLPGGTLSERTVKSAFDLNYNRWGAVGRQAGTAIDSSVKVESIVLSDPTPRTPRAPRKTAQARPPARTPRARTTSTTS